MSRLIPAIEAMECRLLLADWTFLVFLNGDNDLESAAIQDINEMEAVGSTEAVNVVVQMDRIPGYNTSNGLWTDTRRGLVTHDTNTKTISTELTSIGEVNMGSPAVLTDFIQWGVGAYPADKYALIIWNHGGGLDGVSWDYTSDDNLEVAEVAQALANAGTYFDLLGFDACLMQMMEVAYEAAPYANTIVASEDTIPFNGWNYQDVLSDLNAAPEMTAPQLGTAIVSRYRSWYPSYTFSALSSSGVQDFAAAFDTLTDEIIAANDWGTFSDARWAAEYFDEYDYRDLGTFVNYFVANGSGSVKTAAIAASVAYDEAVISKYGNDSTGMTIFLPSRYGTIPSNYTADDFTFLADTSWRTALEMFISGMEPDSEPVPDPIYEPNLTAWIDPAGVQTEVRPGTGKGAGFNKIPFTIYNEGNINATGNVTVDIYAAEGTTIEKTSVLLTSETFKLKLKPGASKKLSMKKITVPDMDIGDYHLIAQVNSTAAITESDYTDNYAASSAVTLLDSGVDFSASVGISEKQNYISTSSYMKNVSLVLSNDGVIQSGGAITINLYASTDNGIDNDDVLVAAIIVKASVNPLKPKTIKLKNILAPALEGDYYLLADLNIDGQVVETDYDNNTAATASAVSWV